MTPVDLDHLAELERAATPGEWHASTSGYSVRDESGDVLADLRAKSIGGIEAMVANGELIAAARNALPALLAELRASRAVVAAAREAADHRKRSDLGTAHLLPYEGVEVFARLSLALAALDREVGR
jgi:hypothetical protein